MRMRKTLVVSSVILAALALTAAAWACGAKGCCGAMPGVKHEVANTPEGVTITFTADTAEGAKAIQEKLATCTKGEKACKNCVCTMDGVKPVVTDTEMGAVVALTADKAETVKAIQEKAAACMKAGAKGCGGHEAAKGCSKSCSHKGAGCCAKKST